MKSKGLTLLLSVVLPGTGHLYIGYIKKGFVILVLSILLTIASNFYGLITFLLFPIIIYSIIDSLSLVNEKNDKYEIHN